MAYKFGLVRISGKGLKRVARQQLRRLERQLENPADWANGHHEARKCVKRLRALLRLVRPAVGRRATGRLDRPLAAVGRALSGARDASVLIGLIDQIARDHGAQSIEGDGRRLRTRLDSAVQHKFVALAEKPVIAERIRRFAKRLKKLDLDAFGTTEAFAGMAQTYRTGRRALTKAYATENDDDFHHLRKQVQRHWRHMQLFNAAWPAELEARIELARSLAELLGDDHDHAVLREHLRNAEAMGADHDDHGLRRLCRARQQCLRLSARSGLRQLFAETPSSLERRLLCYWVAACENEPAEPFEDASATSRSAQ